MRDRLIELLNFVQCKAECCGALDGGRCGDLDRLDRCQIETIADSLLANGVIAPPCNIGQTVWLCTSPENISGYDFDGGGEQKEVFECVVENITFYSKGTHQVRCYCNGKFVAHYLMFSDFGKVVFLTREEAERALKGGAE